MDNSESVMAEALAARNSPSAADQLKSDPAFIDQYLAGDKATVARMTAAIQEDIISRGTEAPNHQSSGPSPVQFGTLAPSMTLEELSEMNAEVQKIVEALNIPKQLVQPMYDRATELSKSLGQDPEANLEERLDKLHTELRKQWGENYDARYRKIVDTLNGMPELDEFLYDTGAWSDPWFMSTLSRVVEGEL